MEALIHFHILRPAWLLALLPWLLLVILWIRRPPRPNPWRNWVDEHLLEHLAAHHGRDSLGVPLTLLLGGWLLAVCALAGPSWSQAPVQQFRSQAAPLLLVFDLSRSMDADDLRPSRLEVAKARARLLLERLPARPVGLVAFAGQAHAVMPITDDTRLIGETVDILGSRLMPVQGSRPLEGIRLAAEMAQNYGARKADILLLGDTAGTETFKQPEGSPRLRISVWAFGTAAGGEILLGDGTRLQHDGTRVRPRLQTASLSRLAETFAGRLIIQGADGKDVEQVLDAIATPITLGSGQATTIRQHRRDYGPWLILLLVGLAATGLRRGWLFSLLLVAAVSPPPAFALAWEDLWWRPDQQAQRALLQGNTTNAPESLDDPLWQGVAYYRKGDYRRALERFSREDSALALYNRGNTLVQLDRFQDAANVYREVLALQPGHAAARYNLDLVLAALAESTVPLMPPPQPRADQRPPAGQPEPAQPEPYTEERMVVDEPQISTELTPTDASRHAVESHLGGGAIILPGSDQARGKEGQGSGQAAGYQDQSKNDASVNASGIGNPERADAASAGDSGRGTPAGSTAATTIADEDEQSELTPLVPPSELVEPKNHAGLGSGSADSTLAEEDIQALYQWLERIPDDPTGLLREKFRREAIRRAWAGSGGLPW